ncbi:MAG: MarR family transcriptional regulator [Acidobacteriota bacterium]
MPNRSPRVFHLVQQAHSALFRAADKLLRRTEGITAGQHGVLLVLSGDDGVPITTIADKLKMGKSSLTGLVDRMSDRGLVRRAACPTDGRVQLVTIEPAGRELLDRRKAHVKRTNERLLAPFSSAEQETIERFLRHVADNASDIVEDESQEHKTLKP